MKTRRSDINKKAVFAHFNHNAYMREMRVQAKKEVAEPTTALGKAIAKVTKAFKRTTNKYKAI